MQIAVPEELLDEVKPRTRSRVVTVAMACVGVAILLVPALERGRSYVLAARERANVRECHAIQKTIAGAMEMCQLDRRSLWDHKTNAWRDLDPSLLQYLVSSGYLDSVPNDPGQGAGSALHFTRSNTGNGVTCTVHGQRSPPPN